ncbi:integrase/recombinase xerD homolog [Aquarana catesbeiana]|uniref:integrase/recombinase xerD homolog n=1 Tax=Aquarana catesbeiana TaxID=8400 RepID=UPI003CC9A56A
MDFVQEIGEESVGGEVRLLLIYYIARKMEEGVSASVVNKNVTGLAFLFKLQGQMDFTKDFWVRQAMKGYRKAWVKKDARRPVTFEILQGVIAQLERVCSSGYEVLLFKVAFLLAFFGAFRIGELVSPSKRVQGGLSYQDVKCETEVLQLYLRKSKTDQLGRGRIVRVYPVVGSLLCPVGAVREFLGFRPVGMGPFLVHSGGEFLSRFQFGAVFAKCIRGLGLTEKDFSSHSFRIGAATEAARNGLGEEMVKRIGRWESKRFQSYVRPNLVVSL